MTQPNGKKLQEAQERLMAIREQRPKSDEPQSVRECTAEIISRLQSTAPESAQPEPLSDEEIAEHHRQIVEATFCRAALPPRASQDLDAVCLREEHPEWWANRDMLVDRLGQGFLFALVGDFGCGKTVMAASVILEACGNGVPQPFYTTAPIMVRKLRECFRADGPSEEACIRSFVTPGLLVIDEAHERGETDYEDRRLGEIIDLRYQRMRDTLLISNLTVEQFAKAVGPAVIDRINHCGGIVACEWQSFRRQG